MRQSELRGSDTATAVVALEVGGTKSSDREGDIDDGVLFGDSCDRRVFFPNSNENSKAKVLEADQSLYARSTYPLVALGLLPPSPYVDLKRVALHVPAVVDQPDVHRTKFPTHQKQSHRSSTPRARRDGADQVAPKQEHRQSTEATHLRRKSLPNDVRGTNEMAYEHVYSREQILHVQPSCRSSRRSQHNSRACASKERHQAAKKFQSKSGTDETASIREVTRLRREADPSILLRRFLRVSGLPLDYVFATVALMYRRARLRPALIRWQTTAAADTRRVHRRTTAASVLQSNFRGHLARKAVAQHRRTHGRATVDACRTVQRVFRAFRKRKMVPAQIIRREKDEELRRLERDLVRNIAANHRAEACRLLQAAWRGSKGRKLGAAVARTELRHVLAAVGGGRSRSHRVYGCDVPAGCLEHVALERACEVVFQLPGRGKSVRIREILALLRHCRRVLDARQNLRGEMKKRWAEQTECKSVVKSNLARKQHAKMLQNHQSQSKSTQIEEQKVLAEEREKRKANTDMILSGLRAREKKRIHGLEEEHRRRHETYLMWREEVRHLELKREIQRRREGREARELVMMRREDLLTKKAWALRDSRARHMADVFVHEESNARLLFSPSAPSFDGGSTLPSTPVHRRASSPVASISHPQIGERPGAVILDGLRCKIGGIDKKATVVLRPSDETVMVFWQAAVVRATVKEEAVARKRVAHWGGRCRVDAEFATKLRGEQFRLRCKTKGERTQKASDDEFFREARASRCRLRVMPQVAAAKDMTQDSIRQLKAALREARQATLARARALADALGVDPPENLLARKVLSEFCDLLLSRDVTVGPHRVHPQKRVIGGQSDIENLDQPDVGQSWNREWCRSVDAWCRRECIRFRSRVEWAVVQSARRLHWLGGGVYSHGTHRAGKNFLLCGSSLSDEKRSAELYTRKNPTCKEGWVALAKLGDVPDLMELNGSDAELEVSIELQAENDLATQDELKTDVGAGGAHTVVNWGHVISNGIHASPARSEHHVPHPDSSATASGLGQIHSQAVARTGHEDGNDGRVDPSDNCSAPAVRERSPSEPQRDATSSMQAEQSPGPHHCGPTGDDQLALLSSPFAHEDSAAAVQGANDGHVVGGCQRHTPSNEGRNGSDSLGVRTARVILRRAAIGKLFGIPPLSAFVLHTTRLFTDKSLRLHHPPRTFTVHDACNGGAKCKALIARDATNPHVEVDHHDQIDRRVLGPAERNSPFDRPSRVPSTAIAGSTSQEGCCTISESEKRGLACAIETLVLPHLRIFVAPTGAKHLRLEHIISDEVATPTMKETEGFQDAHSEAQSTFVQEAKDVIQEATAAAVLEVVADKEMAEAAEARKCYRSRCASRYLRAPSHRWVGRVGGRRCLLSCPAAQFTGQPPWLNPDVVASKCAVLHEDENDPAYSANKVSGKDVCAVRRQHCADCGSCLRGMFIGSGVDDLRDDSSHFSLRRSSSTTNSASPSHL